jgi:hypothetical protein
MGWILSRMNMPGLCQVYISHMLLKILHFALHTIPLSVQALQVRLVASLHTLGTDSSENTASGNLLYPLPRDSSLVYRVLT